MPPYKSYLICQCHTIPFELEEGEPSTTSSKIRARWDQGRDSYALSQGKMERGISLLSLPREIRDMIYSFSLPSGRVYVVNVKETPHYSLPTNGSETCCDSSLLLACTQIYIETYAIFYSRNTFVVCPSMSWSWSRSRLIQDMHNIQKIRLDCYAFRDPFRSLIPVEVLASWLSFIRKLPNIQELRVNLVGIPNEKFTLHFFNRWVEYLLVFRHDRHAWNKLDLESGAPDKRKTVRRELDIPGRSRHHSERYRGYREELSLLRYEFGGEVYLCDEPWGLRDEWNENYFFPF